MQRTYWSMLHSICGHKLTDSITDMCHLPLLTCTLYFSTQNFRIISHHPFVVTAELKNGHFAVLKAAVLHSVQNDINGSWIFFRDLLLYIISGSCINFHLLSLHTFKYSKLQNKVILALCAYFQWSHLEATELSLPYAYHNTHSANLLQFPTSVILYKHVPVYTIHRAHLNLNPWPGTFKGTTLSCSSVKG